MIAKLSLAALALAVAVPVLAQTTATISPPPADPCASGAAADCAGPKPAKLGTNIIPLAAGDSESEGGEGEGGDED